MEYEKRLEETLDEYLERLATNKGFYEITWIKIAELMNKETGFNYDESKYRKDWAAKKKNREDAEKYSALKEKEIIEEYKGLLQEIKEERVKLRDNRTALAQQIRAKAKFENIMSDLKDHMEKIKLNPLTLKGYEPSKITNKEEILVCSLADLHYGAEFKNHWGEYSPSLFVARLEKYLKKIVDISKERNIQRIKVLGLGDMVGGIIHVSSRIQAAEDVISQIQNVSEYISNFLFELSKNFSEVEFCLTIGNHGRVVASKEETLYNENFEKLIPWYIQARLSNINNIIITKNDIDEGIAIVELFDYCIFACHGDKDSFQKASETMPAMIKRFPSSIWMGHMHSFRVGGSYDIEVIQSGSFSGTDEYAKNCRLIDKPSQVIAIYNKEGLDCIYKFKL
jgi:hypothetical protein